MRDELFDRDYQAGRDALNDGIDRLIEGAMTTFRVMSAVQFHAPWRSQARKHDGSLGSAC